MKHLRTFLLLTLCGGLTALSQAADSRADYLKLLDRPHVAPAPEIKSLPSTNGLAVYHFTFATEAGQRVPGLLVKTTNSTGRRPVVIVMHGTSESKEKEYVWLNDLAARGFVAVAIDGRYHGERSKAGKGTADYNDAIVRAWQGAKEHPFYYDTTWDAMRLVDYLVTRPDVDPQRIGLAGISKGGIETYLTAAADPRIAVAVPCIGVQSFHWALENNSWQSRIGTIKPAIEQITAAAGVTNLDAAFVKKFYDRVVPGIDGEFDGPQMLPLIAPRPLLVINGDSDARTPLPGLKECTDTAQAAYHAQGADDHFVVHIQEKTGHRVNPEAREAAIEWFVKWLKP